MNDVPIVQDCIKIHLHKLRVGLIFVSTCVALVTEDSTWAV